MVLLTPELRAKLIANAAAHHEAMQHGLPEPDPAPVVKFFNPCGAATWLFSELERDGDTLFGPCNLGFGCPELGSASLAEIASVTVAIGLKIERDLHYAGTFPLSVYAEVARQHGGIVENDTALAEAASRLARERNPLAPSIPPDGDKRPRAGSLRAGVPLPASTAPQRCPGGGATLKHGVSDMQIESIPLDHLSVSKANMRQGKKPPDVSDILPSIIKRGVLSPLFVRPNCNPGHYEIVAGKRRFFASEIAAKECEDRALLPCIVLGEGDDAEALEVSMIENLLRQNPDRVTQWESYKRLVKEGRSVEDIAATFALTEVQVKRILALGNLLPRIREAFRAEEIDAATVKHLTLASKAQQKAWLALYDDEEAYTPHGQQLKAWLFGGASVSVKTALFDVAAYDGQIVTNLFEEDGYFADADQFWTAQMAEVEKRKAALIEEGWSDVIVIPPHEHFSQWEHEKTPKRKGGRVYIQCRDNGEVVFHEGYVTTKEAQRIRKAEAAGSSEAAKPTRPELTSTLASYADLHRHAAVRHQLAIQSSVALRVMVAHAICGSQLWSVKVQEQKTRNNAVNESIENCVAEARFDEQRRAVLDVLGFDAERVTVTCDRYTGGALGPLVTRLLELPDAVVMEVLAIVMAETLASGSDLIEMLGPVLKVDMADYWMADAAFYEVLRDREVGLAILAEVGGSAVATANAAEKGKTVKGLIADFLTGDNGRPKTERWVPRWMAFPPSAYTTRGGVATVKAAERARWIAEQERPDQPDPDAPVSAAAAPADTDEAATVAAQVSEDADERLAA